MKQELLEEVVANGLKSYSNKTHTAIPATIVAFDPENQLAQVQIAINTLLVDNKEIEIPPLINIPVAFIRGGGFSFTQPIAVGDECLLVFCEKSIDRWKTSGAGFTAENTHRHALSDAIASVFISSQPNKIPDFDAENLQLKKDDGSVSVTLKKDGSFDIVSNSATITIDDASNITAANDGGTLVINSDKNISLSNDSGAVSIDPSGNVSLGNVGFLQSGGSALTLFANGKINMVSDTEGESLFDILKDTLNTLAITTVTHEGTHPINQQGTFASLAARINKFIP